MMRLDSIKKSEFARKRVIELGYCSKRNGAHFGSSLSLIDILCCLYSVFFPKSLNGVNDKDRTRFILSKGHGALGYFSVLEAFGFLSKVQTSQFEVNGSNFFAHAHKDLDHGIEYSGGSLGLGVSFAVGIALANKLRDINSQVIVLAGDGECDEGIVWESLMSAAHYDLKNFTIIVDRNGMQSDGLKSLIMSHQDVCLKAKSFGFQVHEIDGHDHVAINEALTTSASKPKAIIANTTKGKGVSFMESNPIWHHGSLNDQQYTQALKDLER